jgi:hypothetical protein
MENEEHNADAQVPAEVEAQIPAEVAQVHAEEERGPADAQVPAAQRQEEEDLDMIVRHMKTSEGLERRLQMKNVMLTIVAERPDRMLNIGLLEKGWRRGKYYYSELVALAFLTRELCSLSRTACIL